MNRMLKSLLVLIGFLFCPLFSHEVQAQIINAASCSASDVQKALNQVAASTTTVNIPAGTCTWTTSISWTIPSGNAALTIIGAGSQSVVGGGDATVIIDHTPHTGGSGSILNFSLVTNAFFRFSGITIKQDSGSTGTLNCDVGFGGKTNSLRVDHNHFWGGTQSGANCWAIVWGAPNGVFDHNLFDMTVGGVDNGVRVSNGQTAYGDTSGNANGSWDNPTNFGTSAFIFFEDNTYNYSISNDCNGGGRQVFRHNTFNDSSIQTHEMEGDQRGCRATEVYNNIFNGVSTDLINSFSVTGFRMGTGLVWGNAVTNMENLITLSMDRTNGHPFNTPPNGFGYCGTLGVIPGPSNWDGNSGASGYPCIDQPGRGQSDVLTGNFPNKCDSTTGCSTFTGTWPHNKLEPIYEWLNKYQVGGFQHGIYNNGDANNFVANRDYYQYTLSWNGSSFTGTAFNGTVGTGSGLLAARPSTCTAGPGGTYGSSPTGSYGVAYWATDANSGNGELYICTATNTWTAVYTPYTYPHLLVVQQSSVAAPAAPTSLTAAVQ